MKKIFILNLLLFIFNSASFSQGSALDSLRNQINTEKADTNKLIHLNKLSRGYNMIGSYDSAVFFANSALKLSNEILKETSNKSIIQTAKKHESSAYNNIGNVYTNQGNYSEALKNYSASLKIREEMDDKPGQAASLTNMGNVFFYQGNYPEGLKSNLAALKIYEITGVKEDIADSYNNIGTIYHSQGNYNDALKNYQSSLKLREAINDKKGISDSYNNIGAIFYAQRNYEEALKNYTASLKIREVLGNKRGIGSSYNNIGEVYFNQAEQAKDLQLRESKLAEALKSYLTSLKIKEEIGDKGGIARAYLNIGTVFAEQKKYKEAEKYFIRTKELAKETGYKEGSREVYNHLANLDSAIGNYKGAYENHKLYILYRDSLENEETRKKTVQSQMTYDFEKKEAVAVAEHKKELENQKTLSEEESRKQKVILLFVLCSLILVIVFSGFIFRSLKITRKQKNIIELQKDMVERQKQEVEHQKILVEEHQKEIIDSITYAKRLQQAILPSNEEIKKHLPESFILYKPKDIVAGDFYWLHVVESDGLKENPLSRQKTVFIAAADSTGHGVPGAMVSVVCSNALNRAVTEFDLIDTGKILDKTRELVLETFAKSGEEISDGMDISLLSFNKEAKQVSWSGANNQLWYIRNKELLEIKPDKQPIGKTEDPKPFTAHMIDVQSGDIIYLMTDGYADQFGGKQGKKFKYKQLQQVLINILELSLEEQLSHLDKCLHDWKGDLEQVDDITIIGIRI